MDYFFWNQGVDSVQDKDVKRLLDEILMARPPLVESESNCSVGNWLGMLLCPWPHQKFRKIEANSLHPGGLLTMRVAQLVDSSIYRLLTDMARIAQDSAENHHTKRLYNAINQMAQRIYGRKRKKERKSRRSAP
jgi:hypothetical protein